MFLDSIISALSILTYWETHFLALGYLTFLLVPVSIVSLIMKKRPCSGMVVKCVNVILLPILQVIAVMVFTLVLSPIVMGIAEEASWRLPWRMVSQDFSLSLGLLGCLAVVAIALVFVPVLGRIHSFRTLILGTVSLIFVQMLISYINPAIDMEISYMVPGFWFIAGIAAITGALSKLDHYVSGTVSAILRNKYEVKNGVCELVMFPLVSTFGFIPVFIYGAWLA